MTIKAVSYERYNMGVKAKRLYGSSTGTRFYVWEGEGEHIKIEAYGPTPGERKSAAIAAYLAKKTGAEVKLPAGTAARIIG